MKVILSEVIFVVSYFVGSYFVRELFRPGYCVRVILDKLFRPKAITLKAKIILLPSGTSMLHIPV